MPRLRRIGFVVIAAAAVVLVGCEDELTAEGLLAQYDSDADGINDAEDLWPYFAGIPIDRDQDGLPDRYDPWPDTAGVPATPAVPAEPDYDGDGVPDSADQYPAGEDRVDSDADGTANVFDDDPYGAVNEVLIKQIDSDADYTPDWLDPTPFRNDFRDEDGDGYSNYIDSEPTVSNDYDNDGYSNSSDYDPYDDDEW